MTRYAKIISLLALGLTLLTSCAAQRDEEEIGTSDMSIEIQSLAPPETDDPILASERARMMERQKPYYVPQEEWVGLETRAYPELGAMAGAYIAAHPNGNPDIPDSDEANAFMSYVTASMDSSQYSLTMDNEIMITLSFLITENSRSPYEKVSIDRRLNLDRWNGTAWERMLYYSSSLDSGAAKGPHVLYVGKTLEKSFRLQSVITKLTPGMYRLVAYVNTNPVYAEFELTE